jgi:hypothetical protein
MLFNYKVFYKFAIFNVKIANPNSGVLYNFGEQIKPLYVDDINLAEIETGIPKLELGPAKED